MLQLEYFKKKGLLIYQEILTYMHYHLALIQLVLWDRYLPSKFYIKQEPSTLETIGYSTDIRLTSKPSLRHHYSLYLVTSIYL